MGCEYRAHAMLDESQSARFLDALAAEPRWATVKREPGQIALRDADSPARDSWPEDFAIHLEPQSVYVVIHGGPVAEAEILTRIQELLAAAGLRVSFEEL